MPDAPSNPPTSTTALTWVLLGDVHLAPRGRAASGFDPAPLAEALCTDIQGLCMADVGPADLVMVVGDLVREATPDEYARAHGWLERLAKCAGTDASRVLVVPGNHDVDRERVEREVEIIALHDTVRARADRTERASPAYDAVLGRPFEDFARLASRLLVPSDAGGWPRTRPYFTHALNLHGHAVRIVGWNTAWFSDAADARGALAAPAAMVHAAMAGRDDELVIVLGHHPLEWLARGEAIRAAIEPRVHINVSAHTHEVELAPPARSAAGMLSLAVGGLSTDGAASAARFRYAICRLEISFEGPVLRIWARSSPVVQPGFVPDTTAYGEPHAGASWRLPLRPPGDGWLSYRDVAPAPVPAHKVAQEQAQSEQLRKRSSLPPRPASIPPPPPSVATDAALAPARTPSLGSFEAIGRMPTTGRPRTGPRRAITLDPATVIPRLPPMPLAPGMLVGRDDLLQRLGERLQPGGTVRVVGLVGGPGEGKSALALSYATAARDRGEFPGGVFWFDAAMLDPVDEAFRLLAAHLAPPGQALAPLATVVSALGPSTRPVLLVFDGIRTPQTLAQIRVALGTTTASVMYTAEYPPVPGDPSALVVPALSLDASVALLQRGSGVTADAAAYARIAKLVGRNALALGVAARMVSGGEVMARVADELARAIGAGSATAAAAHFSLFERRWPRAPEPVRNAWLLCGACHVDAPLPWSWLLGALRALGASEAEADAVAGALTHEAGAMIGAHGEAVRLHPSAHAFARGRLNTLDDETRTRLAEALARGACAALEAALPRFDTAACVRALPHVETLLGLGEHAGAELSVRLAGVAALAAIRAGGVAHVERVRPVLDTALSPEALANPAWCDHAIELLNAFVELDTSRLAHGDTTVPASLLAERESQLAILLRSQGTRDALERARQLLERSIARTTEASLPPLLVASRRVELARTLLEVGSVEALHSGRGELERVIASADVASDPAGAALSQRVRALGLEIDGALRSAQAAGLRR